MKKLQKVLSWFAVWYLLNSIMYYVYTAVFYKIKELRFSIFYYWWLVGTNNSGYKIYVFFWTPIIIATAIFILSLIFIYRNQIKRFVKTKYTGIKQNTKSYRIKRLEQELEELKQKSK